MKKYDDVNTKMPWPAKLLLILVFLGAVSIVIILISASSLATRDTLRNADLIIVISGGGNERVIQGVKLYQDGWAPKILFSGAARDPESPSNAESMKELAIKWGVQSSDIILETEALTTYQNALNTKPLVSGKYETVILVTSAYHQLRASKTFENVYGEEIEIINSPANVSFFEPWGWWHYDKGRRLLFSEYGKLIYATFTGKYERDE